jgi:hypothetical protein
MLRFIKPVDTLVKLIWNLLLWWAIGGIGDICLYFLFDAFISSIIGTPLDIISQVTLYSALNGYMLFSNIRDIVEFIKNVKWNGFQLY